jgi:hypothetical protein
LQSRRAISPGLTFRDYRAIGRKRRRHRVADPAQAGSSP